MRIANTPDKEILHFLMDIEQLAQQAGRLLNRAWFYYQMLSLKNIPTLKPPTPQGVLGEGQPFNEDFVSRHIADSVIQDGDWSGFDLLFRFLKDGTVKPAVIANTFGLAWDYVLTQQFHQIFSAWNELASNAGLIKSGEGVLELAEVSRYFTDMFLIIREELTRRDTAGKGHTAALRRLKPRILAECRDTLEEGAAILGLQTAEARERIERKVAILSVLWDAPYNQELISLAPVKALFLRLLRDYPGANNDILEELMERFLIMLKSAYSKNLPPPWTEFEKLRSAYSVDEVLLKAKDRRLTDVELDFFEERLKGTAQPLELSGSLLEDIRMQIPDFVISFAEDMKIWRGSRFDVVEFRDQEKGLVRWAVVPTGDVRFLGYALEAINDFIEVYRDERYRHCFMKSPQYQSLFIAGDNLEAEARFGIGLPVGFLGWAISPQHILSLAVVFKVFAKTRLARKLHFQHEIIFHGGFEKYVSPDMLHMISATTQEGYSYSLQGRADPSLIHHLPARLPTIISINHGGFGPGLPYCMARLVWRPIINSLGNQAVDFLVDFFSAINKAECEHKTFKRIMQRYFGTEKERGIPTLRSLGSYALFETEGILDLRQAIAEDLERIMELEGNGLIRLEYCDLFKPECRLTLDEQQAIVNRLKQGPSFGDEEQRKAELKRLLEAEGDKKLQAALASPDEPRKLQRFYKIQAQYFRDSLSFIRSQKFQLIYESTRQELELAYTFGLAVMLLRLANIERDEGLMAEAEALLRRISELGARNGNNKGMLLYINHRIDQERQMVTLPSAKITLTDPAAASAQEIYTMN
ncbi:MAG: hypothetical protein FJZ16_08795 [Candidatus Omnitrophica bacterium]|nr:hypothetical protein [Candidatus Omnitrophota bacterium]